MKLVLPQLRRVGSAVALLVALVGVAFFGSAGRARASSVSLSGLPFARPFAAEPEVTISGVVRDAGGQPVRNAQVLARPVEPGPPVGARTTATGAYSFSTVPGEYTLELVYQKAGGESGAGGQYVEGTGRLLISENLVENWALPALGSIAISVVNDEEHPVSDVNIQPHGEIEATAISQTEEGTRVYEGFSTEENELSYPRYCDTDGSGVCTFRTIVGATLEFRIAPPEGFTQALEAEATVAGDDVTVRLPSLGNAGVQGVVVDAEGHPLRNANVYVRSVATNQETGARTDGRGAYSLPLPVGEYTLDMDYEKPGGRASAAGLYEEGTVPIQISEHITENWALPAMGTVTIAVRDANGSPVENAAANPYGAIFATAHGQTEQGTAIYEGFYTEQGDLAYPAGCNTPSSGDCTFETIVGASLRFNVRPPFGGSVDIFGEAQAGGSEVTARLSGFVSLVSTGTVPGTVELVTPPGTELTGAETSPSSGEGLPEGAEALVGVVTYEVAHVALGGTIEVIARLPPGSHPSRIYKIENDEYVDVTSLAKISENVVTLTITDGGLGDEDGSVNGVIVDPVVPVRIVPRPEVSSVAPRSGPGAGGTRVTVSGGNLAGATSVNFGSTRVEAQCSMSQCSAIAPSGRGTVHVSVTTLGGTSLPAAGDEFMYVGPTITKLSAKKGPAVGGTAVTIIGTDLLGTSGVRFGATAAASFEVLSATEVKAVAPAATAGPVTVTVATPDGASPVTKHTAFKYGVPSITSVSPSEGLAAGGARMVVIGSGFAVGNGSAATAIMVGKTAATAVVCGSTTRCEATVPPGKVGVVDVVAAVAHAKSKKTQADRFMYR